MMGRIDPAELPHLDRGAGWPWQPDGSSQQTFAGPPRITLVTPSFNQRSFVEATLRSVLLQGYPELEYLVFDAGSTDGTVEVLRAYEPWLTHLQIAPDRGQSHAINLGLSRATGRIVGWLNSDDRLLPGALWRIAAAYRTAPEAAAWVGGVRSVTPSGRTIFTKAPRGLERDQLADWGREGDFGQPGCFFSREAFERAGPADEALHFAFDVELWLRLSSLGRFVPVDAVIAEETLHPAAKTQAQRGRSLAELHLVQLRHGYQDLALRRLSEELQEYELLRAGTLVQRARWQAGIALRTARELLGRRR